MELKVTFLRYKTPSKASMKTKKDILVERQLEVEWNF